MGSPTTGAEPLLERLRELGGIHPQTEHAKANIQVWCASQITKALEASSAANDKLGRRVFWLNVVLTIATVVGAIATVVMAFPSRT